MELTEHASVRQGYCTLALAAAIGQPQDRLVQNFLDRIPPTREKVAFCMELPEVVVDEEREQWETPTHLAAIARDGVVVTVFFTRFNQLCEEHLRVEKVEL